MNISAPPPLDSSTSPFFLPSSVPEVTVLPPPVIGWECDSTVGANTTALPVDIRINRWSVPPAVIPRFAKVLHVINGEQFSGAERVQQLLGRSPEKFGVRAEFACVKPGRFPELCGLEPDQVSLFPMTSRLDMRVVRQLVRKVQDEDFDLLHAHTPRSALVAAWVAAKSGLPWCYHVHSPTCRDSTRGIVNQINAWMEGLSLKSCSRLFTVSRSLRREMLRQGVQRQRLVVIPNGVPPIEPIETESRLYNQTWHLGMIALMRPRKGVEIALEAIRKLRLQGANVGLELIGGFENESYKSDILALIDRLRLQDTVSWTGFTSDIPSALHRLDALLLPSLFGEGMPMVVLEALSAAVPVVATRVEGTPEVVRDGVEGFLAEPNDADSLAEKIGELIRDRGRWQQLSQAALIRHRKNFSDREMSRRVAKAYRQIMASD